MSDDDPVYGAGRSRFDGEEDAVARPDLVPPKPSRPSNRRIVAAVLSGLPFAVAAVWYADHAPVQPVPRPPPTRVADVAPYCRGDGGASLAVTPRQGVVLRREAVPPHRLSPIGHLRAGGGAMIDLAIVLSVGFAWAIAAGVAYVLAIVGAVTLAEVLWGRR